MYHMLNMVHHKVHVFVTLACLFCHVAICPLTPFSFYGFTHLHIKKPPSLSFVLTEDGTSFAPKRLTELVVKKRICLEDLATVHNGCLKVPGSVDYY